MIAVWCEHPVTYSSKKEPVDPVVLFDLSSLGVKSEVFLTRFAESFTQLPWDYYDVRREHLQLLRPLLERHSEPEKLFTEYYLGNASLEDLLAALGTPTSEVIERIARVTPYRRRTTARFTLEGSGEQWNLHRESNTPVVQGVPSTDYRSLSRVFPETTVEVVEHPQFVKLLHSLGNLVVQADELASVLEITAWQTSIRATSNRAGSNSPEGIHQDGADYIVSALVVARENIGGGISRVFAEDKSTEHLTVALQPGQGIFQADTGSTLWHDVTPIEVANPEEGDGIRNLFGFDINVKSRG